MMYRLIIVITLAFLAFAGYSQTATQRLNQVEDDYEAGRLIRIPDQIIPYMSQLTKEERIRAKKLLTLVYIFTDQEQQADLWMVELLKEDPEHRLDPKVDPAEIFFLYDQFRTEPILKASIRGGVNFSNPKVTGYYSTGQSEDAPVFINGKTPDGRRNYQHTDIFDEEPSEFAAQSGIGLGFWGELMGEKHIKKGVEMGFGLQVRYSQYHVDQYLNEDGYLTNWTNRQLMLRTPIQVKYTHFYFDRDRTLLPYALLGASFDYLISAKYNSTGNTGITSTIADEDLKKADQVNNYNGSFYGGLGVKIRKKTHFWTIEGRYDHTPWNYNKNQNRFTNQTSTFDQAFVEPNLSLNFISIAIGFTYSIHKPIKIR